MTELNGTVAGAGLPAIIGFLRGLKKSGCLRVGPDDWRGEVFFDGGLVIGATFGPTEGLGALDALIQTLPEAAFEFESRARGEVEPSITLSEEELKAHLDQVTAADGTFSPKLPLLTAVPHLVEQADAAAGGEPLPLDRATLRTLLAVDGRRSVREIVAHVGTFQALWQLATLSEVGLIGMKSGPAQVEAVAEPVHVEAAAQPIAVLAEPAPVEAPAEPVAVELPAERVPVEAPAEPVPVEVPAEPVPVEAPAEPIEVRAVRPPAQPRVAPRRPIRLPVAELHQLIVPSPVRPVHCPKLGFEEDPSRSFDRPTRLHRCFATETPLPLPLDQQRDLCMSDQFPVCPRLELHVSAEPIQTAPQAAAPARSPDVPEHRNGAPRTPLRARMERLRAAASAGEKAADDALPPVPAALQPRVVEVPLPHRAAPPVEKVAPPPRTPLGGPILTGVALVLVVLVAGGVLLSRLRAEDAALSQAASRSASSTTGALPAATATTQVPAARSTPAARATGVDTAPPAPAIVAPSDARQPAPRLVFDESFDVPTSNAWPDNPESVARLTSGSYRIATRQAGQFVAIGAPIVDLFQDVIVSATFRKVGGPPGGGYGIIVRDQSLTPLNGLSQDGRYYVLEAGDKGEIGMWRRDGDRWVDLVSWLPSTAVKPGTAANELTVRAAGNRLSLSINGVDVASRNDATYPSGRVGIFVGGDGNEVAVTRFTVQRN